MLSTSDHADHCVRVPPLKVGVPEPLLREEQSREEPKHYDSGPRLKPVATEQCMHLSVSLSTHPSTCPSLWLLPTILRLSCTYRLSTVCDNQRVTRER